MSRYSSTTIFDQGRTIGPDDEHFWSRAVCQNQLPQAQLDVPHTPRGFWPGVLKTFCLHLSPALS